MFLNDVSQLVQFLLYFAPDPQRGFVSCGSALKIRLSVKYAKGRQRRVGESGVVLGECETCNVSCRH